jgi:hypothetical protein
MAEEGFLRPFLPTVGGVELLFVASFSSCSFEMVEGFSRYFLPVVRGLEILFFWQVSFLADLKWLKVSGGLSFLVVSHQELLQRYWALMYLQLSSKCRRQIYRHQPTHHSG